MYEGVLYRDKTLASVGDVKIQRVAVIDKKLLEAFVFLHLDPVVAICQYLSCFAEWHLVNVDLNERLAIHGHRYMRNTIAVGGAVEPVKAHYIKTQHPIHFYGFFNSIGISDT